MRRRTQDTRLKTDARGPWFAAVVICGIIVCGKALGCEVISITAIGAKTTASGTWQGGEAIVCECKFWVKVVWLSAGSENHELWYSNWLVEIWEPGDPNTDPNKDFRDPNGAKIAWKQFPWDIVPIDPNDPNNDPDGRCPGSDKVAELEVDDLSPGEHTLRAWVIRVGSSPKNAWKYSDPITVTVVEVKQVIVGPNEVCVGVDATFTADPNPPGGMLSCMVWDQNYSSDGNSWGGWTPAGINGDKRVLNTDTPGYYQYRAKNCNHYACTDCNWAESDEATVVKVEDVNFSCSALCTDGSYTCTASASIAPSGRDITWSILDPNLGCDIDANSGVITAWYTPGTITVRAADANVSSCYKQAPLVVLNVDLVVDGLDDLDEDTVGGLVVLRIDDNGAPRKKITLTTEPATWSGDVTLTRNPGFVKVFDAASGGDEITFTGGDNVFAASGLPKDLWVQGSFRSSFMRDVTLTLTADGTGCEDDVKFTVLWVAVTTDHTGTVETDNAARSLYGSMAVPPDPPGCYDLGQRLICTGGLSWEARDSEFLGRVFPINFRPSDFSSDPCALHLCREVVNGKRYWGPNGNENSAPSEEGDDTSDPIDRDDDPQSGGSPGYIYDLDGPGLGVFGSADPNTIIRKRTNYKEWAEWLGTRCSTKKKWYTRQSYKKTGSSDSGSVSSATSTTLTDSSKSWVSNEWAPGVVKIHSGTGAVQFRRISSNTGTTITITPSWDTTPNSSSGYEVISRSTWTEVNDVSGDNKNADGTTNTSWNLL